MPQSSDGLTSCPVETVAPGCFGVVAALAGGDGLDGGSPGNKDREEARRSVVLVNTYGLHMRPSTRFVNLASTFASDVRVHFSGIRANGKSLLDMTCLAAPCGAWIDLEAVGDDAEEALDALAALVADGFHMGDEAA